LADLLYVSSLPQIREPRNRAALEAMVRNFGSDAVRYRHSIRELLDDDRTAFLTNVVRILKSDTDSRAVQYLLALLVSENLLYDALCDPALNLEQARAVARLAARVDPMVDVGVARRLAEAAVSDPEASSLGDAGRILQILGEISDGTRILPSLMRLLRNANPYLRSKAVLMIGRGSHSVKWVRHRLGEADSRVRANAVEALWGVDSAEARELLRFAASDVNNRVAGNALLGLYWLGNSTVISELVKMAGHASSSFRLSAAWAMGETGDPRFSEVLGRMLADLNAGVRKRAFAAVSQIKLAAAQLAQNREWLVSAFLVGKESQKTARRVRVAVVPGNGSENLKFLPTHFIVSEDNQAVMSYQVFERPARQAMTVIFVFPRTTTPDIAPWNQGALRCLDWKRPTDLWCTVPYLPDDDSAPAPGLELELPPFSAQPQLAAASFTNPHKRTDCTDFWTALWRTVRSEAGPVRGKRHLIVFAPGDIGRIAGHGLVASVISSRTSVQVIATGPNSALQDFCRMTGGTFRIGETDAALADLVTRAYLNLLARYDITYQPVVPCASAIRVRVNSPTGWGESSISIPTVE
jgi:HEAT repeat protein